MKTMLAIIVCVLFCLASCKKQKRVAPATGPARSSQKLKKGPHCAVIPATVRAIKEQGCKAWGPHGKKVDLESIIIPDDQFAIVEICVWMCTGGGVVIDKPLGPPQPFTAQPSWDSQ